MSCHNCFSFHRKMCSFFRSSESSLASTLATSGLLTSGSPEWKLTVVDAEKTQSSLGTPVPAWTLIFPVPQKRWRQLQSYSLQRVLINALFVFVCHKQPVGWDQVLLWKEQMQKEVYSWRCTAHQRVVFCLWGWFDVFAHVHIYT